MNEFLINVYKEVNEMGKENLVEVIRCKDCDFFIGSDLSNVGHCSMWNKATIKDGYCHLRKLKGGDNNAR